MQTPSAEIIESNLFLLIEMYLAKPTSILADKIKNKSHVMTDEAYEQAKKDNPGKNIGADEYGLILLDNIALQIAEAYPYSARIVTNNALVEGIDPLYIVKVNRQEQQQINALIGELLQDKAIPKRHPDGLIFAFDKYIERQRASAIAHTVGKEDIVYRHNGLLFAKACELRARGDHLSATILFDTVAVLKEQCDMGLDFNDPYSLRPIVNQLMAAQNTPEMKEHKGYKHLFINFLLALSVGGLVYLAVTAEKRQTFWLHVPTKREEGLMDFSHELQSAC